MEQIELKSKSVEVLSDVLASLVKHYGIVPIQELLELNRNAVETSILDAAKGGLGRISLIRMTRRELGLSLREAKEWVDGYVHVVSEGFLAGDLVRLKNEHLPREMCELVGMVEDVKPDSYPYRVRFSRPDGRTTNYWYASEDLEKVE